MRCDEVAYQLTYLGKFMFNYEFQVISVSTDMSKKLTKYTENKLFQHNVGNTAKQKFQALLLNRVEKVYCQISNCQT